MNVTLKEMLQYCFGGAVVCLVQDEHEDKYSRQNVYNYEEHVRLAKQLDADGRLPATFMVCAPGSWTDSVWDDINRMRTLNTSQRLKKREMHICPLQLDVVERAINRWSNPGDLILDPFGGLMTVPYTAIKAGRRGIGIELNADYFRDGLGYLQEADAQQDVPTMFDLVEEQNHESACGL